MLFSTAFAQAASPGIGGGFGGLTSILPFVLIFVVFYFLLIRPQQKKMKDHRNLVAGLKRGDRVITAGGIIGQVAKVVDNEVQVDIAEGVRVRVVKSTITDVLSKPAPADAKGTAVEATGNGDKDKKDR